MVCGVPRVKQWPMHHVSPLAQQLREAEGGGSGTREAFKPAQVPQEPKSTLVAQKAASILIDAPLPDPPAQRQPAGQPKASPQPAQAVRGGAGNSTMPSPPGQKKHKGGGGGRAGEHFQAAFPNDATPTRAPAVSLPLFSCLPPGGVLHRPGQQYSQHPEEYNRPAAAKGTNVAAAAQDAATAPPPVVVASQASVTCMDTGTPKSPLRSQKSVTGFGVGLRKAMSVEDPETLADVLSSGKLSFRSPRAAH